MVLIPIHNPRYKPLLYLSKLLLNYDIILLCYIFSIHILMSLENSMNNADLLYFSHIII